MDNHKKNTFALGLTANKSTSSWDPVSLDSGTELWRIESLRRYFLIRFVNTYLPDNSTNITIGLSANALKLLKAIFRRIPSQSIASELKLILPQITRCFDRDEVI